MARHISNFVIFAFWFLVIFSLLLLLCFLSSRGFVLSVTFASFSLSYQQVCICLSTVRSSSFFSGFRQTRVPQVHKKKKKLCVCFFFLNNFVFKCKLRDWTNLKCFGLEVDVNSICLTSIGAAWYMHHLKDKSA